MCPRITGWGFRCLASRLPFASRRGAHCAPENTMPLAAPLRRARRLGAPKWPGPRLGAPCMPNHNGIFAAMRRRHTRGETRSFSPLANHPVSFRTRCARKSKWHLPIAARPPQRVSKSGVPPRRARRPRRAKMAWATTSAYHLVGARIARPHTCTRPERRLHGNGKRKPHIASTPAPGVRRETEPPRRYRKSNFSTVCGQICLRSRASVNIPRRG